MTELSLRREEMSPAFVKWHVEGLPCAAVFHSIQPDHGAPHDHPWPFVSYVLCGGYVEEVFTVEGGHVDTLARMPGESFTIEAGHIHRIVQILDNECVTLIRPGAPERVPGFYEWRADGCYHRFWNGEWERVAPANAEVPQ